MSFKVHILGIRHHGPGSARSVVRALDELKPDCVLIEGPPDADDLIRHAGHADMTPPVAILVYDTEELASAVYYPLAEFSPEWQAMRWALAAGVAVRFMDLPQSHRMAVVAPAVVPIDAEDSAEPEDQSTAAVPPPPAPVIAVDSDPLSRLAKAAGFDDGERWWEHVVEHRQAEGLEMFTAVREAMSELRADESGFRGPQEDLREAWMRRTIREEIKNGRSTIAVVCGAWHAPVLDVDAADKKADDELLKGLAKKKTAATWVPWTYDRLTFASGYGAGIQSPGWYDHLWKYQDKIVDRWMSRVARLLRENQIDCSSSHVIEAVRLSRTLASFRDRPLADLSDIADATRSVFCFDSDAPLKLIARELLVGHRIGDVPEGTPMVPLQQDLLSLQKRLRMKPEALEKTLELDLRNESGLERSVLLHRLRLLGIDWGTLKQSAGGKGTFHEDWLLRWDPAFAIKLVEAGALGNTVQAAAAAKVSTAARESDDLTALSLLLKDAILADLDAAVTALVAQIQAVSAVTSDVSLLMRTLPPLTALVRYGNVRQTDQVMVLWIINGIVPRVTAGLGAAVASLNDEAAEKMTADLRTTNGAIDQLDDDEHKTDWLDALQRVVDSASVHGLVRGASGRMLLDGGRLKTDDIATRLSQTLSRGADPGQGARWLEGFLSGSGVLLLHDPKLLGLIDQWVAGIDAETFQALLPLLRRTFSTFPSPERRQIGAAVAQKKSAVTATAKNQRSIDRERAARVLPLLREIYGVAEAE